jgi:hypothetical protein
MALKGN